VLLELQHSVLKATTRHFTLQENT